MARPTLRNHPKFLRLCHVLGIPEPHVYGHLEYLWSVGYESGNEFIGDSISVELSAKWAGERGALCEALLDCGFIDAIEGGNYVIHDLLDHAPAYVLKRFQKEYERNNVGSQRKRKFAPRNRSLSAEWRENRIREPNSDLGSLNGIKADIGTPPAPAPIVGEVSPTTPLVVFEENGRGEEVNPPGPKELLEAWNAVARFRRARSLDGKRLRHFQARARCPDWASHWRAALKRASQSSFCCGGGPRGWRADIDWFLRPETVTKILEGNYDDNQSTQSSETRKYTRAKTNEEPMSAETKEVLRAARAQRPSGGSNAS